LRSKGKHPNAYERTLKVLSRNLKEKVFQIKSVKKNECKQFKKIKRDLKICLNGREKVKLAEI